MSFTSSRATTACSSIAASRSSTTSTAIGAAVLIHLSQLKKHATGKGNVDKAMMIAAAKERFGLGLDENAAEALGVAAFTIDNNLFAP